MYLYLIRRQQIAPNCTNLFQYTDKHLIIRSVSSKISTTMQLSAWLFPIGKRSHCRCQRSLIYLFCFWFIGLGYFQNVFLPLFQYIHSNPRRLMNHMKGLHIMCAYSICILGGKLIFSVNCYPSLFLKNCFC